MIRTPGAVGLAEKGASLEWHKRTVADAGNGFFPTSSYPFTQRLRLVYLPMADYKEPVSTQPKVRAAMIHPVVSDTHPPFFFFFFFFFFATQGTAPMAAGGNKNALNCPIGPDGQRDWSYGLFDCFSACGLCA